jgi:ribosomal protein S18 acetylase RimI-like enzyme/sugar phosphate isomerase/epimerase
MGVDPQLLEISQRNTGKLISFIDSLDDERRSFRYFGNRSLSVLDNHEYTCLLMYKGIPVGYGHLDNENGIVWLGIVVKKEYQGRGYSKQIMSALVGRARELKLENIQLSVDNDNIKAIALYERFGFELIAKKEHYSILKKDVSSAKKKEMTYGISTLAFHESNKERIVELAKENEWIIEFSSSFPFQKDMIDFFVRLDIKRLAHNYFPAPRDPFVINLASTNDEIRHRSIDHCIQGLRLTKKCGAPCFSAHAGFCIDPDPHQLGKRLEINVELDRELNWKYFIDSVRIVLFEAEQLGLSFFIENNVTSKFNLRKDGKEVLFCSRPEEMIKLVEEIASDRFGLLLDTAHLKVSSRTFDFDMNQAVEKIKPFVKYIHHSDNDGDKDTNESIRNDYWFLPWIARFGDCIHILEVKNIGVEQIKDQLSLLNTYEY